MCVERKVLLNLASIKAFKSYYIYFLEKLQVADVPILRRDVIIQTYFFAIHTWQSFSTLTRVAIGHCFLQPRHSNCIKGVMNNASMRAVHINVARHLKLNQDFLLAYVTGL